LRRAFVLGPPFRFLCCFFEVFPRGFFTSFWVVSPPLSIASIDDIGKVDGPVGGVGDDDAAFSLLSSFSDMLNLSGAKAWAAGDTNDGLPAPSSNPFKPFVSVGAGSVGAGSVGAGSVGAGSVGAGSVGAGVGTELKG